MLVPDWRNIETEDTADDVKEESLEKPFESSFTYHAIPLDEQMTLNDNGTPFTLRELMDLHELGEELDGEN